MAPGEWPLYGRHAQSLGMTRDRVAHAVDQAVHDVEQEGRRSAVDSVLAETATLLARDGRVMTVTALCERLGCPARFPAGRGRAPPARRRPCCARPTRSTRACPSQRWNLRRGIGKRADVIALARNGRTLTSGQDFPPADVLTETAIELGRRADELVATGVVPFAPRNAALSDIVSEAGASSLIVVTGRRLLALAAAVSTKAAVSGFDELYPVDLDPQQAVERALRGQPGRAHQRDRRSGGVWQPASRRSSFPVASHPTRRTRLCGAARGREPQRRLRAGFRSTLHHAHRHRLSRVFAPVAVAEAAAPCAESLSRNGALTLTTPPNRYVRRARRTPEAVRRRSSRRASPGRHGDPHSLRRRSRVWEFVLGVDAARTGGVRLVEQLAGLVQQAL